MTDEERQFDWVLRCPCGTVLEAGSEDAIVEVSLEHLRERHPDMHYEREHILFMAEKYGRS